MKKGQRLWTRDELIIAMGLYCRIPFGKLHSRNPEIISLATLLGRTPSSVAYKLVNFASLDPALKARGIKGASNASKLDKEIWLEFVDHWNVLPYESERLRAKLEGTTVEKLNHLNEDELPRQGRTREQIVKVRVNQSFFRSAVLAAYDNTCCITGIRKSELLIAGHIRPWGLDEENRLNPRNGIAINALHDKAFDAGLITITPEYIIQVSSELEKTSRNDPIGRFFTKYANRPMILPSRFLPDKEFLKYHNDVRFRP